jgi:hypothetical protein
MLLFVITLACLLGIENIECCTIILTFQPHNRLLATARLFHCTPSSPGAWDKVCYIYDCGQKVYQGIVIDTHPHPAPHLVQTN